MVPKKPNIVLVHVDQWRADCLGFAGHRAVETPHIDGMFARGVAFSRAYAAVPSCIASRASLMTGLAPRSHGRVGYRDGVPWTYGTTLAGTLGAAGYHTQAVGKMHVYPERNLLGFHNVVLHDGYLHHARKTTNINDNDDYLVWLRRRRGSAADYTDTGMGCNGYAVAPWCYDTMEHPMAWVTSESIDFLRRRDPTRPFFLYVSYHRPHPPFDPPRDYLDMYASKVLDKPVRGDWDGDLVAVRGVDSPVPHSPDQMDRARKAYYAQLTFIDHQINRIVQALNERGVLEDTWILFVSDHGDMLYDHNRVAKAVPYEASARVPLVVRFPDSFAVKSPDAKAGRMVDAPVEMRDIFPTLCDIAGIPIPAGVEGKSLLPFIVGDVAEWREYIHGEHEWGLESNQWLTDGKIKYIWFSQSGVEQLFDLSADPNEQRNLAAARPDVIAEWRRRLIAELDGREEGYVEHGRLVAGRKPTAVLTRA